MTKTKPTNNISSSKTAPQEMDWDHFQPLEVKVYNGNFDQAFKQFRLLVQTERVLSLYKEKQSYEKPSEKRRRKHNESIQKNFELEIKKQKMASGQYEKDKLRKQKRKEQRQREVGEQGYE